MACPRCSGAPAYVQNTAEYTLYCGPGCQNANWDQHKERCEVLQARKTLQRAALILQNAMYAMRRNTMPFQFRSLRLEGSALYLEGFQHNGMGKLFKRYPSGVDGDELLKNAALVHMAGDEAMIYLYHLAFELFGKFSLGNRLCTLLG